MTRAFNNGIMPQKIGAYLKNASSQPLPDNVRRSLDDWQAKVGRVNIRSLTVIETDDALLLEEIKHIRNHSTARTFIMLQSKPPEPQGKRREDYNGYNACNQP